MPLNYSKKIALVQLCNCISPSNLTNLKELADGEFFRNIICSSFEEFSKEEQSAISSGNAEVGREEAKVVSDGVVTNSRDGIITESSYGEVTESRDGEIIESKVVEVMESRDYEVTESKDYEVMESGDGRVIEPKDEEVTQSGDGEFTESRDGEFTESGDGVVTIESGGDEVMKSADVSMTEMEDSDTEIEDDIDVVTIDSGMEIVHPETENNDAVMEDVERKPEDNDTKTEADDAAETEADDAEKTEADNTAKTEVDDTAKTEVDDTAKTEVDDTKTEAKGTSTEDSNIETEVVNKNFETEEQHIQESVVETVKSAHDIILQNFLFVQNFIDERYGLKSDGIISYSACIQKTEFELAKVAVFVLSEVVKHLVLMKNEQLSTLAHLEVKVQEDLEECFRVFIFERESLSKKKVEKILSTHAKYRNSSPPKNSFVTPRRSCASKYRFSVESSPTYTSDDVFTNSPLKSFFESPIFKKEDIMKKDREIARTVKTLHAEELKAEDLEYELQVFQKQLKQKDSEIKKLKGEIRVLEQEHRIFSFSSSSHEEDLHEKNEQIKRLKQEIQDLNTENTEQFQKIVALEHEVRVSRVAQKYRGSKNVHEELHELNQNLEKYKTKLEFYRLREETASKEKVEWDGIMKMKNDEIEMWKCKYLDLLKEKSAVSEGEKDEPDFPGAKENVGAIIEEENKQLYSRLKEAEVKVKELENKLMAQPQQNNVPTHKPAFDLPELLDMSEQPEPPRLKRYRTRSSNKNKELTVLSDECDISSNSEVASKHSAGSSHSGIVPFTENTSGSYCGPFTYGALWKKTEYCQMESENASSVACTDEFNVPENDSDTPQNSDLCSRCRLPVKNGYKLNAINLENEYVEMCRDHLKLKEEIEKLKTNCDTLQEQCDDLQQKCEVYENETLQLQQNCEKKEKQIIKLEGSCDNLQDRCKIYLKEQEESYKVTEDLKAKLLYTEERFKAHNEKSNNKISKLKESCKTLALKLEKRETDYKKLHQHYKAQEDLWSERYSKRKEEIEYLKERISEAKAIHEDQVKQLQSDKQELEKKVIACEIKIQKLRGNIKEKYELLEQKKLEIEKHKKKIASLLEESRDDVNLLTYPHFSQESFLASSANVGSRRDLNESILSGALCSRNGLQFVSQDEADFLNQSSLQDIRRDDNRFDEIVRRNSILPFHLQSSYPVEPNLTPSVSKFYVKKKQSAVENEAEEEIPVGQDGCRKKRKRQDMDPDNEAPRTPLAKAMKRLNKYRNFIHFDRTPRNGPIKPNHHKS